MSVEPFDPSALALKLDAGVVAELIQAAADLDAVDFGLSRERIGALAAIARHDARTDWRAAGSDRRPLR